jgi:hypothetical protein
VLPQVSVDDRAAVHWPRAPRCVTLLCHHAFLHLFFQVCKRLKLVVDSVDNWNDCRIIGLLRPHPKHFKQTSVLRSGTSANGSVQMHCQEAVCWPVSIPHGTTRSCATCRWFHQHHKSVTSLRLLCLHNDKATAGLRNSFITVLFGILSTTLKRLVVTNCSHVCRAWPLCCIPAWQLHERHCCATVLVPPESMPNQSVNLLWHSIDRRITCL